MRSTECAENSPGRYENLFQLYRTKQQNVQIHSLLHSAMFDPMLRHGHVPKISNDQWCATLAFRECVLDRTIDENRNEIFSEMKRL